MYRLPRVRNCLEYLSRSSKSLPLGSCLVKRELWTLSRTRNSVQHPREQPCRLKSPSQRRWISRKKSKYEFDVHASIELDESEDPELDEVAGSAVHTDLKYPSTIQTMPRVEDIDDPSYRVATTAEELTELGGAADWWEDPYHWGSKSYVGFGPQEKVTDPALLEVLLRRALVESIVLRKNKISSLANAFLLTGNGEVALEVRLSDGKPYLQAEDSLKVQQDLERRIEQGEEYSQSTRPEMTPAEARQLASTYDSSWKKIPLEELELKFCIATRIQRLTGHIIPDYKLMDITTVQSLLGLLKQPPKAKKLAEMIEKKTDLIELPNVKIFSRRVTPVDKEQMVGRWKVIVKELEHRSLPLVGTGGHGVAVEKKWVRGGA